MWQRIRQLWSPMSGDPYAKGWNEGRDQAIKDIRAALLRELPSLTVLHAVDTEYIDVGEVLRVIDQVRTHPEGASR
jgi:hypothetical protein